MNNEILTPHPSIHHVLKCSLEPTSTKTIVLRKELLFADISIGMALSLIKHRQKIFRAQILDLPTFARQNTLIIFNFWFIGNVH